MMAQPMSDDLARVGAEFERWRSEAAGRGRIPDRLWRVAILLLETHAPLMVAAAPSVKESAGVLGLYSTHLRILLEEAAPHLDPRYTSEALLAMLDPAYHLRMRRLLGYSLDQLVRGWDGLIAALVTPRP